jgi:hypothetical protein
MVAERAGISRATLSAIEGGSGSVSMGAWVQVLFVLGLENDLSVVARDDALGYGDGADASMGASYLELADLITRLGSRPDADLEQPSTPSSRSYPHGSMGLKTLGINKAEQSSTAHAFKRRDNPLILSV